MMQFPTHVWRLILVKTCPARTFAEVMGQNYSRFKTDSISKIVHALPPNKKKKKQKNNNNVVQCPGVVCNLATPLEHGKFSLGLEGGRGGRGHATTPPSCCVVLVMCPSNLFRRLCREGVQVYGFCIRTLRLPLISGRYDNRSYRVVVQRKSCAKTADFGTICSKLCSCERPILQDVCISGGCKTGQRKVCCYKQPDVYGQPCDLTTKCTIRARYYQIRKLSPCQSARVQHLLTNKQVSSLSV